MTVTAASHPKHRFRIRALLAIGAVVGLGAALTMAAFTDEGNVGATFSTGSLDISFDQPPGTNQGPESAPYTTTLGIAAGKLGSVAVAPLQVNNSGSLAFTYGMTTTAAGDTGLAGALKVTVAVAATTCTQAGGLVGGTVIIDGVTGLKNATMAATRPLAPAANEILCFKVELPDIPANNVPAIQGKTTTATFKFTATQS
ncbi:putative ribosomally synthesized peptide with SipW-like signal peptide [Antricoccus suffuscus]|uniref:Putative ribosomally synthesized peptide with SipW-like signal peptide n=1 Tax=Antricoccus suffuscus TaxID=1629062 RepID=A0A2T1A2A9_9ACTN|nr:SipW-dependent-type signal peptide-containing protein [Antricoccus suffuscus]PRZ42468.1 putative ribosomally synthesized peptide with SipW-like signal peptide [Antricoccus suffuscus]